MSDSDTFSGSAAFAALPRSGTTSGGTGTRSRRRRRRRSAAMGARVGSEADLADEVGEREERPWRRIVPPVLVQRENPSPVEISISLPAAKAGEAFDWVLALEDDRQEAGRFIAGTSPVREEREIGGSPFTRRAFSLPFVPAAGCHTLHVIPSSGDPGLSGDMRLIVTPSTCCHPPVLEGNGRTWGPAFQLYGSAPGETGDRRLWRPRQCRRVLGKAGAGIVGLNPLHSLFPHAPAHASPYSPSAGFSSISGTSTSRRSRNSRNARRPEGS